MDPRVTLDQVFTHPDFQKADIDGQLGYIDKWYAKRGEGEDETTRKSLEFNKSLVRGSHEMKWMSKNDTPARQEFATEVLGAYKGLYDASKNPAEDKQQRAKAILDFKSTTENAEEKLQKYYNTRQIFGNYADMVNEERELNRSNAAAMNIGSGMNPAAGVAPVSTTPAESPTFLKLQEAGFSGEEIEAGMRDKARIQGKNDKPTDSHFDSLSSGEVVFTPEGLLFPDDARKRLASSSLPAGAKRRALARLDEESIAHNQELYGAMSKSNTLRGQLEEEKTKNGGDFRKALQSAWKQGQASPYLSTFQGGLAGGVYDVANVVPSIASAITGGVVGDDTRAWLDTQSKGWNAATEFMTDAGVSKGSSRQGLKVSSGLGAAVPQVAFQLGAAKSIQSIAAAGSRAAIGTEAMGNIGFRSAVGMSGAQSFSGSYNEALGRGLGRGEALHAGMLSGAITALTTAGFGKTGVESIFSNPAARQGLKEYFGSIMVDAGSEALEEFTDEFFNGLVASANYGENRSMEQIVGDALTAGSVGFIMGGSTRTLHGRGHDKADTPAEPAQADLTEVPEFDYDFDSPTVEVDGKQQPNKDQVVLGENGKYTVADEAFEEEFDTVKDAQDFARKRHWLRFQDRVASEFGDPNSPEIKTAVETVGRVADGLARSGINPDKDFFANILTEQDVRETVERSRATDEKRTEARKADEAKMTEEANAAAEAETTPLEEDSKRTIDRVEDKPEAIYRELMETTSRPQRFREFVDDIGPQIDAMRDRANQLKAKKQLSEEEQTELDSTEDMISRAIMEENDASRAAGDESVTSADVAPEQSPGSDITPMDAAFQKAEIDGLKKQQAKLQGQYDKVKNKNSPQATKLEEQIIDLESRIQAPPETRRRVTPVAPSASPTVEIERTVESRITDAAAGVRSLLERADLNATAQARQDLNAEVGGQRLRVSPPAGTGFAAKGNLVKFFDRKGGFQEVVENIREAGALDDAGLANLEKLGTEMMGAVGDWVATKTGRPTRQVTDVSTDELSQSQAGTGQDSDRRASINQLPRGIAGANKVLIKGFKSADPTSLLHETFHALDLLRGADGRSILEVALGGDFDAFNKWRTRDGAVSPTSTEALERSAVGFEQYLKTGKAPAPQLRSVFAKMASIFKSIYGGMRNILMSTPQDLGGQVDLTPAAIRAYDRLFTGVGPKGVVTPVRGGPEGSQPEPGPLRSVQQDPRFKLGDTGAVMVPTVEGQPQKGFANFSRAKAFRNKAADRLGVSSSALQIDKFDEKYFVYAHPTTQPKLFANQATGNTAEAAELSQGAAQLWSNGEYSITKDPHPQAYAMGWSRHRMQLKRGDEVVGRLDLFENPTNPGWYEVALANIEPAHRGKKMGTELYRQALLSLPANIKGISSDIELRTNKDQIPRIYAAFNGYEADGFAFLPRPQEATTVPDAARLATGLATSQGSTLRVDGIIHGEVKPQQIRVEYSDRGRAQAIAAMMDEASAMGVDVHEVGPSVTRGEMGLQKNGSYNAPFVRGYLREGMPWAEFAEHAKKAGIENFTYNDDTGEISFYELDADSITDKANRLLDSVNESRTILGGLQPEVRNVKIHQAKDTQAISQRAALGENSNYLSLAEVRTHWEARKWGRAMNPGHARDPLSKEAYAALESELPGVVFKPTGNAFTDENNYQAYVPVLRSGLARWALASIFRSDSANKGLLPIHLAGTGNPEIDGSLNSLANQLRGSSRADYVVMGTAAGATDNKAAAMEPKDPQSQEEISLAQSERFSRELDRVRTLDQIALPKLLPHAKEKKVSSLPTGLANFFWKPIAKMMGGLRFSPWRQVQQALADNPLAPVIGTWWRYRDIAKRAAYKVSREMANKYGDVWDIDVETGNIMNFTSPVSPSRSKNYIDVFEAEMETPGSYPLTAKQQAWIADSRQVIQDAVKQMLANGIPMKVFQDAQGQIDYAKVASNYYFPRRVVGSVDLTNDVARSNRQNRNGSSAGPRKNRGFDRSRKYDTALEGSNDGIVYDPDPLSALEGFLRDTYSKIGDWRTINDPDLAGSPDVASVKRGTRVVKVGDISAVFDEPTAAELEKWTNDKLKEWDALRIFKNSLGFIRALKLGIDFSAPIVQGAIVTINHPIKSLKAQATAWKEFFSENGGRDFFLKREPHVKEFVEAGGALGSALDFTEVAIEIGKQIREKSSRAGKLYDQTVGRFNRFHSTFMDAAAIEYWGSLRRHALDANGQLDPEKAREVALMVDRLVGRETLSAYGFSKDGLNAAALFATAPSMYVAYGNVIGSLFSKNPTEAKIAWQELSKFTFGGTLAFIGTALAAGMEWPEVEERLKPWNSKFLTVRAGMPGSDDVYEFGVGGFFRSVTRMLGQLTSLAFDNRNNTAADVIGPLQSFAGSRVAPGVSALLSVYRGVDHFGSPKDRARLVIEGIAPIAFTDLAVAASESIANIFGVHGQFMSKDEKAFMDSTPQSALIQVVGLNAYPVEKRTQWYDEAKKQSKEMFGREYDELSPVERIIIVEMNAVLKGAPPGIANFDLDNFLRNKSDRVSQYVKGDAQKVLADVGLLERGIPGPQAYKTPSNVAVPMTKDEQVAMEKAFAAELNSSIPHLAILKTMLPEPDYQKVVRDAIKHAEDMTMIKAGWPQ